VVGFLVGEALRDLRRAGRVAVSAIVLITLSLAALGGFWLVSSNLGPRRRAVARPACASSSISSASRGPPTVAALLDRVRSTPGWPAWSSSARRTRSGRSSRCSAKTRAWSTNCRRIRCRPSLEVTAGGGAATPEGARSSWRAWRPCPRPTRSPVSADWVEQLSHWQRLLTTIGLGVGAVLGAAAILTSRPRTTLLHARRHEDRDHATRRRLRGDDPATPASAGDDAGTRRAVLALGALVLTYSVVAPRLERSSTSRSGSRSSCLQPRRRCDAARRGTLLGGLAVLARAGREP